MNGLCFCFKTLRRMQSMSQGVNFRWWLNWRCWTMLVLAHLINVLGIWHVLNVRHAWQPTTPMDGEGESSSAVNDYPIIGSVCGHFNETVGAWGFICEGANVIVIFINKIPLNM